MSAGIIVLIVFAGIIFTALYIVFIYLGVKKHKKREALFKPGGNEFVDMSEKYEEYFENLDYDKTTNILDFKVIGKTTNPKISRYVTKNYVRTPIFEDYKVRTKIIKKFNKIINIEKFAEIDLKTFTFDKELINEIIEKIGYTPSWRIKEKAEEKYYFLLKKLNETKRDFEEEKENYTNKPLKLNEETGNFPLRLVLAPFSLGLSFLGFNSKKKAKENIRTNSLNDQKYRDHILSVDFNNDKIFLEIKEHNKEIEELKLKAKFNYDKTIEKEEFKVNADEDGWMPIKLNSYTNFQDLRQLKGIYIIRNKTKEIYYVGQSKDLGVRLNQHFKPNDVGNVKFAKDWYDGDLFQFKYIILDSKDELDREERRLIDLYDSYANGYNSTSGNS